MATPPSNATMRTRSASALIPEAGGWERFSALERGVHYPMWMQWMNPFDGLVYFSRISGPGGRVMLDGDFIRLNTMASDGECRSVVSLNVIAGGLVAVADRHDTAGDRLRFYQNRELTALVQDGFTANPSRTTRTIRRAPSGRAS